MIPSPSSLKKHIDFEGFENHYDTLSSEDAAKVFRDLADNPEYHHFIPRALELIKKSGFQPLENLYLHNNLSMTDVLVHFARVGYAFPVFQFFFNKDAPVPQDFYFSRSVQYVILFCLLQGSASEVVNTLNGMMERSPELADEFLTSNNAEELLKLFIQYKQTRFVRHVLRTSQKVRQRPSLLHWMEKKLATVHLDAEIKKAEQELYYREGILDTDLTIQQMERIKTAMEEGKQKSIQGVLSLFEESFRLVDKKCPENLRSAFIEFAQNIDISELQFLKLIIEKYGLFNPKLQNFFEHPNKFAEIFKTDSQLFVGVGRTKGIFVNVVPLESAKIWKELAEEQPESSKSESEQTIVPVAPIYKFYEKHDLQKKVRVITRYCGLNIAQLLQLLPSDIPAVIKLRGEIESQVMRIRKILEFGSDITHGHLHTGNYTVEFIDEDYYNQQIALGTTVNTLEFDAKKIIFDPLEYLRNPEKYRVAVRVIDWDQAREENIKM